MSNKNIKIFDETGCLSEDALVEYVHGNLGIHLKKQVEIHINECDFCRDALEGISLIKNEAGTRAAVLQLNERILNFGKPVQPTGKVILMTYWRLAAAIALFFVLGGGVLYIAINPPLRNETAQTKQEEKVLAANNDGVQKQLQDSTSIAAGTLKPDFMPAPPITGEKNEVVTKEAGGDFKNSDAISETEKQKVAEDLAEKDESKATYTTVVTANGAAGQNAIVQSGYSSDNIIIGKESPPVSANTEVSNQPAPETLNEISAIEISSQGKGKNRAKSESDKSDKKVSGKGNKAAKAFSRNEETAQASGLFEEKSLKQDSEARFDADQQAITTGSDALKVADDRKEMEQARKQVEDDAMIAAEAKKEGNSKENNESGVFVIVEEMPQYPGGEAALKKYISENIKYPQVAKEQAISGTVYVTYIVSEKGKVSKVAVSRGVNEVLDAEAVRIVSTLKGFLPGKQRGKPVQVLMTIPVRFSLQ